MYEVQQFEGRRNLSPNRVQEPDHIVPGVYQLGNAVYTLDGDGDWWYWSPWKRWTPMGTTTIGFEPNLVLLTGKEPAFENIGD